MRGGFHNYHHVPLSVLSCISYVVLLVFLFYVNILFAIVVGGLL